MKEMRSLVLSGESSEDDDEEESDMYCFPVVPRSMLKNAEVRFVPGMANRASLIF